MAADRTSSGDPTSENAATSGQLSGPEPYQAPATLASKLVPVVDKIRQLSARFGIRPYRVFLVHTLWSGTRIGEGASREISRREILPVPKITDISATTEMLRPFGLTEEGGLVITEISARFTEDDLMGRTPDLQDVEMPRTGLRNAEFAYEVVENRPSMPASVRRRYKPSAVPTLTRDNFQWKVILTKTDYDSGRQGGQGRTTF